MIVNWKPLDLRLLVGQNEQFEDVALGSGKLWRVFFTIFWHFIEQLIVKIIWGLTDNETESVAAQLVIIQWILTATPLYEVGHKDSAVGLSFVAQANRS